MLASIVPAQRLAAIEVSDLRKAYGGVQALAGVNLRIDSGEFVAILGPSGSGKTTLLQIVAGLVRPDGGHVTIAGRLVEGPAVYDPPERRELGVVFQDYALWPHLTAWDHVAFPLLMRHLRTPDIRQRVATVLAQVDLTAEAQRLPDQLSGGQQQRLAMARALAPRPNALLLDEPLSNLDASLRNQMRDELLDVCRQSATACLYVTHDQREALGMADRVVVMAGGRVLQEGTPQQLFSRPNSEDTARIIGSGEIVPGATSSQGFQPEGLDTTWQAPRHPALGDPEPAVLVIPSARIALGTRPRHRNSTQITVARCAYQGDRWALTCALTSGLVMRAFSDCPYEVHSSAYLSFKPDDAYITYRSTVE
ncbi:MAG: ABC transporter ATP-binding protein [Chloroflexi bacterium]|nr:ABC transporter ATP-binding protein [Chloroflexota bacterium]